MSPFTDGTQQGGPRRTALLFWRRRSIQFHVQTTNIANVLQLHAPGMARRNKIRIVGNIIAKTERLDARRRRSNLLQKWQRR